MKSLKMLRLYQRIYIFKWKVDCFTQKNWNLFVFVQAIYKQNWKSTLPKHNAGSAHKHVGLSPQLHNVG